MLLNQHQHGVYHCATQVIVYSNIAFLKLLPSGLIAGQQQGIIVSSVWIVGQQNIVVAVNLAFIGNDAARAIGVQQVGNNAAHFFGRDVQQGGYAVEQFFLRFRLLFLHFHRHANGVAGADIDLAADIQLAVEFLAQLVAQEEGQPGAMIKAIHQRLAEERIVEVTDFLVGNTRAGIIDVEHQAIGVLGFMINHQRNLAAGGSDNRVMHQQRDHLA